MQYLLNISFSITKMYIHNCIKRNLIASVLAYSNSYPWKVHYTVCLFQDIRNKSRSMGHYENKYHNHRSPGIRSITFAYLRRKNKVWQSVGGMCNIYSILPSKKSFNISHIYLFLNIMACKSSSSMPSNTCYSQTLIDRTMNCCGGMYFHTFTPLKTVFCKNCTI